LATGSTAERNDQPEYFNPAKGLVLKKRFDLPEKVSKKISVTQENDTAEYLE